MVLYKTAEATLDNKEAQACLDSSNDYFVFVQHQTGGEITKAD